MLKTTDFLTNLIDNPSRAKVLRLLVLHDTEALTLLEIARRTGCTLPATEKEIRSLTKAQLITEILGEGKTAQLRKASTRYSFNEGLKYASALSAFIHDISPEQFGAIEKALKGIGRLSAIVLSGVFVGDVRRPLDLLIVGDYVNENRLEKVVKTFEPQYGREIRYAVFSTPEFRYRQTIHDKLLRDTLDYPHRVLMNKNNVL